jgi:hypothetical protein
MAATHHQSLALLVVGSVENDIYSQSLEQTLSSRIVSVHSKLLNDLRETLSQPITRSPSLVIDIQDETQVCDIMEWVDTLSMLFEGAERVHGWPGANVEVDLVAFGEES